MMSEWRAVKGNILIREKTYPKEKNRRDKRTWKRIGKREEIRRELVDVVEAV